MGTISVTYPNGLPSKPPLASGRRFTRHDLEHGISTEDYLTMVPADRLAFDWQLSLLWAMNGRDEILEDYRRVGTKLASDWGE
jgi:hypothetical protein